MLYKGIRIYKVADSSFSEKPYADLEDILVRVRFPLAEVTCWGDLPIENPYVDKREITRVYFRLSNDCVDIICNLIDFDTIMEQYQRTKGINFKLQ